VRQRHSLVSAAASGTALVAAVAGVPYLLVRHGRLPGAPDSGWWKTLQQQALSDTAVLGVLTVAAWVVWAIFTTSAAVETAAALRGAPSPRGVAGPLHRAARALVVTLLLSISATRTPSSAFTATPPASTTTSELWRSPITSVDAPPEVPSVVAKVTDGSAPSDHSSDHTAAAPSVTVVAGDNPWDLAETHLGDGMGWRDLWNLNHDVTQPDGRAWVEPEIIRPGWRLLLPPAQTDREPSADLRMHIVEAGDTLSALAERYLGSPGRYRELFDANDQVVQRDGGRLEDPDLVRVGWQLVIPASPSSQSTPPAFPSDESPRGENPAPNHDDTDDVPPPTVTTTMPTATTVPTPTMPVATTTTRPSSVPDVPAPSHRRSPDPGSPIMVVFGGIGGTLVLATAVVCYTRHLRRRRAVNDTAHLVASTPSEVAAMLAADVPLVRWASQRLARLVRQLDRTQVTGAPLAVELSEDGGIELLWDNPQHAPLPPGWQASDAGWTWTYPYDPEAHVGPDDVPAAIPALVTIGTRDRRQLLVDLEAFGTLTMVGPRDAVEDMLRSMATELALGEDLADAFVATVDVEGCVGQPHRLVETDATDAAARLECAARSVTTMLYGAKLTSTFLARAGNAVPVDVTVAVVGFDARESSISTSVASPPRRGVAEVTFADAPPTDGAYIELRDDDSARLEPLGIVFTPVALPLPTATQLRTDVHAVAHRPADTIDPTGALDPIPASYLVARVPDLRPDAEPTEEFPDEREPDHHNVDDAAAHSTQDAPLDRHRATNNGAKVHGHIANSVSADHELLVRVLGVPSIDGRPGMGRREIILGVLLACRGGNLAASAAQDALWGGKPVEPKTVWNLIANTRRAFGALSDGTPIMPAADRAHGTLRLDPRVTTDLVLLADVLRRSRQVSSTQAMTLLEHGLELVEGAPFDAPGYDWAYRDQDVAAASVTIEQTVELLVVLALDAGRIDVARNAISRGLRALPGNELLYRHRMRTEHQAGNHAGVIAAYEELRSYLEDLDTTPSETTTSLYDELIRGNRPRRGT
jgi:nucleoid-associated protein YgaU